MNRFDRKIFARPVAAALGAAVLASVLAGSGFAQTPADLRPVKVITSLPTLTMAVPYTVLAKQYDKAHGLAVEMQQAGSISSTQIDAVVAGSAMFATPGTATALQAIRAGADLKIIAAITNNQLTAVIRNETMEKLKISPTAPIADRIRALKGLTIGSNPPGATYYQMLRAYMKQYGVDPDKDARIVGIADASALMSGIQQGRFDVIATASGVAEQAIALKAGTLWFSAARGDIPGSESSVVAVIVARSDFIEKQPDIVKDYLAALGDALKAVNDDHAATGKVLRDQFFQKLDPEMWELVWTNALKAYPANLKFSKKAYDFWTEDDPKGKDSFKDVDYKKITYGPAQAP